MYGEYIARLRNRAGYTQREAAAKLGISQGYLGGLEINRNNPDLFDLLVNMAKLYSCTVDELLGRVGGVQETNEILSRLSPERYQEVLEITKVFLLLDSQAYRTEVMEDLIITSSMFDNDRVLDLLRKRVEVDADLGVERLSLANQI